MFLYWLLFAYFAAGAAVAPQRSQGDGQKLGAYLLIGVLVTVLLIGTRWDVGGDWRSYNYLFQMVEHWSLERTLELSDPGYHFIDWVVQQADGEIWWVNLFCGMVFMWGLVRLARNQPSPMLTILIAVPYLIIVVAMGYTRQSVAIGILMAGLASLGRGGSVIRFAGYVAVAALFHKTAVVALPLVIFAGDRNRLLNVIAGLALTVLFFDLFLADSMDDLVKNYVEARYTSQGAWIRVVLDLIPAVILLAKRGQLGFTPQEEKVWRYFAYAVCTLPFFLVLTPSSTAIDRIALYLMPIQLVVMSRVYMLFQKRNTGIAAVIGFAFLIQFIWLNYAAHSRFWLPYRSTLLEDDNDRRKTDTRER